MSNYYDELNKAKTKIRNHYLQRIKNGEIISEDEILIHIEENYRCSTKPVIQYFLKIIKHEKIIREESVIDQSVIYKKTEDKKK